ncbi:MAG: hypothetical protein NTW03_08820 [Verrucomicrobia bacterium]|nr:hypothetical protein [Verrucomicrobiota bacterium]
MFAIYHLNADELNAEFVESLKIAFKHGPVEITVSDADETHYLLRSSANRDHLLTAVKDAANQRNLVVPDQKMFQ